MSSKYKRKWLSLTAALFLVTPVVQLSTPAEVQAVADTFTLTAISDDVISVQLNGTPQVRLPGGTITTTNTTYRVTKNNTYTFVGIDGEVKSQKSITMTNVPNQPPLLIVSPGENVKLRFESEDAHSGVKEMRYRIYNETSGAGSANFTAWETYKTVKDYVIPSIPNSTNSYWVVEAEFRDVAGNVKNSIITRFMIENWAPEISLDATDEWFNEKNFNLIVEGLTKFGEPYDVEYGFDKNDLSEKKSLIGYTNDFQGNDDSDTKNFIYNFSHSFPSEENKVYDLFLKMRKKSNNVFIDSSMISKKIGFDNQNPTATVLLNNGEETASDFNVDFSIDVADNLSGVDIYHENKKKAYPIRVFKVLNPEESSNEIEVDVSSFKVENGKLIGNIDFEGAESGYVNVYVEDRAGNVLKYSGADNVITFAKLTIKDVILTKNRYPGREFNPKSYMERERFTPELGFNEDLLKGSSFEFEVDYSMGNANRNNYHRPTGEYEVRFVDDEDTIITSYTVNESLSGKLQTLNNFDKLYTINPKVVIPKDIPTGARVEIIITLEALRSDKPSAKPMKFEPEPAYVIGFVGEKSLDDVVNEAIQFNEVN